MKVSELRGKSLKKNCGMNYWRFVREQFNLRMQQGINPDGSSIPIKLVKCVKILHGLKQ